MEERLKPIKVFQAMQRLALVLRGLCPQVPNTEKGKLLMYEKKREVVVQDSSKHMRDA